MSLVNVHGIVKYYGETPVLNGAGLQLEPGEKGGVVGPNGSGKTTLLKIIAGLLEPDAGAVHIARGVTAGYLPQEPNLLTAGTLRRYLEKPLQGLIQLKKEIEKVEKEMAAVSREDEARLERLLERYGQMTAQFEESGGYQAEKRLKIIARGLGFEESDLDRELSTFSGGEKTRASLASLLLQEPDLLLLDEPTNYLDLDALNWLEKYLREWKGALLVVSHDRFFLDRVTGRIFVLQGLKVKSYNGNYSAFMIQREAEGAALERQYLKQQEMLAREERLIRESKADERSKRQARSRQKRLDRIKPVEKPGEGDKFRLTIDYAGRSGKIVFSFDEVALSYCEKEVFSGLSLEVRWGDRAALIGPNGAGKSTVLKLIAGEIKPDRGRIRLGPSVKVVYFAQEQSQLAPENTLLEEITGSSDLDLKEGRRHLAKYLFRGDDVFKKVKELSGGEKNRLALARLALDDGNCLLMDEPTSHLDLPAVEELEKSLKKFPGTLIVVSHDRYFLQHLANRVLELKDGRLSSFDGSFKAYLEYKERSEAEKENKFEEAKEVKKLRREKHRKRQEELKKKKKLKEKLAGLEKEITGVEAEIASLEETLSDPASYGDHNRLRELGGELETAREKLACLLKTWEKAMKEEEYLSSFNGPV